MTQRDAEALGHIEEGIAALLERATALDMRVVIITNADEDWVRFSSARFLPRVVPLLSQIKVVSARQYRSPRGIRLPTTRGAAAAGDVDSPRRRVAERGSSAETSCRTRIVRGDESPNADRPRRQVAGKCRPRPARAYRYEPLYQGRSVCWKAAAFTHVAKAFFQEAGRGAREVVSIGDSNDERLAVRAAAQPLDATPKAVKLVDAPSLHTLACQLRTVTTCLPFLAQAGHAIDVDVAAVLSYVGVAHADGGPVHDALQRVWQDAAWGLLTAIRFQSAQAAAPPPDPPADAPGSPAVAALA